MRYSIEPKDGRYVKGYGFSSSVKNMDSHLSNKYSQNFLTVLKSLQQTQEGRQIIDELRLI